MEKDPGGVVGSDAEPGEYFPPGVERVMDADELKREVLYAGVPAPISQ